jgi:hypothetical protein
MGLGEERLCGDTETLFGPGFLPSRLGRHLTLLVIVTHLLSGLLPPLTATVIRPRKADDGHL